MLNQFSWWRAGRGRVDIMERVDRGHRFGSDWRAAYLLINEFADKFVLPLRLRSFLVIAIF